jgi:hypothetical protein
MSLGQLIPVGKSFRLRYKESFRQFRQRGFQNLGKAMLFALNSGFETIVRVCFLMLREIS